MKVFVRASTQADVDYLSNNLRTEDAQEVLASHGGSVEALQLGLNNSEECWTIIVEDTNEIAGMYGVGRIDNLTGSPWLLTSPPVTKIWIPFLRGSRKWVEQVNNKYPVLTNAVDEEYKVAVNWLRFLGFTFIKRHKTWGESNRPFLEFVRIKT